MHWAWQAWVWMVHLQVVQWMLHFGSSGSWTKIAFSVFLVPTHPTLSAFLLCSSPPGKGCLLGRPVDSLLRGFSLHLICGVIPVKTDSSLGWPGSSDRVGYWSGAAHMPPCDRSKANPRIAGENATGLAGDGKRAQRWKYFKITCVTLRWCINTPLIA